MPWTQDSYLRFFPSLSWQAAPQLEKLVAEEPRGTRIADLGAGGRRIREDVVCVDFIPVDGTTVQADVQKLPFADESLDLVIATGLLEHVEDDRALLLETFRVLRPGGRAHFEVPFLQQYHDDPIDCRRLTVDGLRREFLRAGLETERSGVHLGPTVTMITLSSYYVALLFEGRSKVMRGISTLAHLGSRVLLWPAKFLDRFLIGRRSAHRLAFGVYATARKPPTAEDAAR